MMTILERRVMPDGVYAAWVDRQTANWRTWLCRKDGEQYVEPIRARLAVARKATHRRALARTLTVLTQRLAMYDLRGR